MRRHFRVALTVLVSAVVGVGLQVSTPANAGPWDGVTAWETAFVERIVDGDTMIVRDEVTGVKSRIRFIGVNAPEIDTTQHGGKCGGWQAKDVLTGLLPVGTKVRLLSADRSSTGKNDRPQRVVLAVNPQTGEFDQDIAWAMAERGWGVWFTLAKEAAMSSLYRAVIAGAQQRGVGIWNRALCGAVEQPDAAIQLRIARGPVGSAPTDEWVVVRNSGTTAVDLTDWTLRDAGNQGWFTFPAGSVLAPGEYRVVHTGTGTAGVPKPQDLYANTTVRLYPDPGTGVALVGDGAYLLDRYGNFRFWQEYPCTSDCADDPLKGQVVIEDMSLGKKKGAKRVRTQWIRLANRGATLQCLDGFRIQTQDRWYRPEPGTCLAPGATWTLHVGTGVADTANAYWGLNQPAFYTTGTVALVSDRDQTIGR
ncbi:MAG: lamin tail domain-containing protein, partial [Actinomycetales bacterium]